MACTFSTSQLPKVVRTCSALCILTSKCASRHNGVQFFISHLASWLHTRHFSEPTFRPSGATNHWKNTVFRDFPTFSRTWIFFLLRLSLFWYSFFFSSLLFSDSSHLCFSSVHIVGSLASKLPSIRQYDSCVCVCVWKLGHVYLSNEINGFLRIPNLKTSNSHVICFVDISSEFSAEEWPLRIPIESGDNPVSERTE